MEYASMVSGGDFLITKILLIVALNIYKMGMNT
jgi:hypothetical protein